MYKCVKKTKREILNNVFVQILVELFYTSHVHNDFKGQYVVENRECKVKYIGIKIESRKGEG